MNAKILGSYFLGILTLLNPGGEGRGQVVDILTFYCIRYKLETLMVLLTFIMNDAKKN